MNIQQGPIYYGYLGGYAEVTICEECSATGLYEDNHPAEPCHWCGGKVKGNYTGKWVSPITTGMLWWKREVNPGYWKLN